jgi:hypothetical protein
VKDAELSWLDARLIRKSALVPTAVNSQEGEVEIDEEERAINGNEEQQEEMAEEGETSVAQEDESMDMQQEEAEIPSTSAAAVVVDNSRKTAVSAPDQLFLELLASSAIPPHQSVFVNDPKLTDLKQVGNFLDNFI